ncbi:hypothetical protein JT689_01465 (plasmid) [Halobacterium sp. GSL-19]|uniref:hypothetical protein n=1 Tax=Halobacterium sp. GSL-19 TaxID=2812551 RepID=UPI0019665587|nr:hypothetical protein [Halobacterium sp. GSL-19]QRY21758.1 hypothetical protein JT689_01465 [Halobacterium sp. GSL-19]
MADLEGSVVEFEFAGEVLVGEVVDRHFRADIARGPYTLWTIDTDASDATYRVPEEDIQTS